MKTYALIPCRKGSKGIPEKNFKEIAGKPLWHLTGEVALKSGVFNKIIFSSDNGFQNIKLWKSDVKNFRWSLLGDKGIFDNNRPPEFATDEANLDDLLHYYMSEYPEAELWCLLQPTSPLRTSGDIRKAYRMACAKKYDSVVSVTQDPMMYWVENATSQGHAATYHIHKRPNRQDRKGFYRENGAIYFTKKYVLETMGLRLGGTIGLYKMPRERSFEIDDEFDWQLCEWLLNGNSKK